MLGSKIEDFEKFRSLIMRKDLRYFILVISFFFHIFKCEAQQHRIDSLQKLLSVCKPDTNKVIILYRLCWDVKKLDPEKALQYGEDALRLALKLNFKKGIAASYNNMGGVFEKNGDEKRALKFYLLALDIKRELGDKKALAGTLINIGIIYKKQENYEKALSYYYEALGLNKENDNRKFYASNIYNIANILKLRKDYDKAQKYLFEARNISLSLHDSDLLFSIYISLGNFNGDQSKEKTAFAYFDSAITLIGPNDRAGQTIYAMDMGYYKYKLGEFSKGEEFLLRAYELVEKKNFERKQDITRDLYLVYVAMYERSGNKKELEKSMRYLEESIKARDELLGYSKQQSILQMDMQNKLDRKDSEIQDILRQKQIDDLEKRNQRTLLNFFIVICSLLLIFSLFIYRNFIQKKKANLIIAAQKELVEDRNRNILDSIHYAKRIQRSLLPTEPYIERNLNRLQKTEHYHGKIR